MAKGLDGLEVWQRSVAFAGRICTQVLPSFPVEEKWAMAAQLRRSCQSIPANIAEGYGRFYFQEAVRFCYIARGSLEESYSHLILAKKLGYVQVGVADDLFKEIEVLRKLINGYTAFLKQSKRGSTEPGATPFREASATYIEDLDFIDDPLVDHSPID